MFKRSKKLVIGLLIVLSIMFSGATYAYWASSISGNADTATGTVTIGEGDTVTTTVTVGNETNAGPLVPVGHTGINDVDLVFGVNWDGDGATGAEGTLTVTVNSVLVNGVDRSHLFTVDVTATPTIVAGTLYNYTINVEFTNEPEDEAEYNAVVNQDVVISLTFTVVPN